MPANLGPDEQLRNIGDFLAEVIVTASDEEIEDIIREEAAETGSDPVADDARFRQLLLDAEPRMDRLRAGRAARSGRPEINTQGDMGSLWWTSRRGFFRGLAAFAVPASALARVRADEFIVRSTDEASKALLERVNPSRKRFEVLNYLFKPTGRVVGVPGGLINPEGKDLSKWEPWKRIGFPHDRAALDAYAVFARDVEVIDSERVVDIPGDISIVTTGSPAANEISQLYMPYRDQLRDGKTVSRTFAPDCLPYHYEFLAEKRRRRVPSAPGGLADAPHKGLTARGVTFLADNSGDGAMLKKDFLLVSRLPRGIGETGDIISIGGGFGPGTEAFKLLFDRNQFPDEQVWELEKALGDSHYFQVAFVCDIDDDGDARNLRIWDACEPAVIRPENLRINAAYEDDDQGSILLPTWSPPEEPSGEQSR